MGNCWISCQVMADMKKVYDDLIIIDLYFILNRSAKNKRIGLYKCCLKSRHICTYDMYVPL